MRKIEQQMIDAIHNQTRWQSGNTVVRSKTEDSMSIYLHDNHIADVYCPTGFVLVNEETLRKYPTNTTKSRLRALGVHVFTHKGVTYLNHVSI
jgi:hypothetical protein